MTAPPRDRPAYSAKNVRDAVAIWTKNPRHGGFKQSRKFDVEVDGVRYPPKAIIAIAYELAGNGVLTPSDFGGMDNGPWHKTLNAAGFTIYRKSEKDIDRSLANDLANLLKPPRSTTTVAKILARVGQGAFRRELLNYWGYQCAVTDIDQVEVLRAAHIERWGDCTSKKEPLRLSVENGLLLSANLDCLFEVGLIAFSDSGEMLFSKQLKPAVVKQMNLKKSMRLRIEPTPQQAIHLKVHRKEHGFKK